MVVINSKVLIFYIILLKNCKGNIQAQEAISVYLTSSEKTPRYVQVTSTNAVSLARNRNPRVTWTSAPADNGWVYLQNDATGLYLVSCKLNSIFSF